jgi:predicted nucleic acid-binding protein
MIGMVAEAKQRSLIPSVKPLMDALIDTSAFRVSQPLYEQILQMVDE